MIIDDQKAYKSFNRDTLLHTHTNQRTSSRFHSNGGAETSFCRVDLSKGWGKKNQVGFVFSAGSLLEMQS